MYDFKATVLRVVDGDTVRVDIDLGFHIRLLNRPVRIAKINSPELSTDAGQVAKKFAEAALPVGVEVTLLSHDINEYDKYGRVLASLTLSDGSDYGDMMLKNAMAVPYGV